MALDVRSEQRIDPNLSGEGLQVAVVAGRFNDHVTVRLLEGVRRALAEMGVSDSAVTEAWVPGAFELPFAAKAFASSGLVDAVVCIGCVIRGETTHYEEIAGQASAGIQQAQLETGIPIAFGVLTTENLEQALARSEGPGKHNVGDDAARVAVEMSRLVAQIGSSG